MAKLTLKHPIELKNTSITALDFKSYATANDLLAFDVQGTNAQTIRVIANLTGQDESIIGRLHVHDYQAADEMATQLLAGDLAEFSDGGEDKEKINKVLMAVALVARYLHQDLGNTKALPLKELKIWAKTAAGIRGSKF